MPCLLSDSLTRRLTLRKAVFSVPYITPAYVGYQKTPKRASDPLNSGPDYSDVIGRVLIPETLAVSK